ncbi:hypothetical protein JS82_05090 [Methanomassiliicoccaceae archaeon DOK]|nr:hypothetical protein JS82_05090 [Methanomassiliicoccaceae archaeon DOK]
MTSTQILEALREGGPMIISEMVGRGLSPRRSSASRSLNCMAKYDLVRCIGRTEPENRTHREKIWEAVE